MHRAALDRVSAMMAGVAMLDRPDASELGLPAPDLMEIRFLARLRSGAVIEGADIAAAWRSRLHTDRLLSFYAACTFDVAQHYRRRADAAIADGDLLTAGLLAHTAAEHLAFCAVVPRGVVLHESKKLGAHIAALRGLPVPRVLAELEDFVWEPRPTTRTRLLAEWTADLLVHLRADPGFADTVTFLDGGEL